MYRSLTPPEHLFGDGHLKDVSREGDPRVTVVDSVGALEYLDDRPAAEHLQDLSMKKGFRREKGGNDKKFSGDVLAVTRHQV